MKEGRKEGRNRELFPRLVGGPQASAKSLFHSLSLGFFTMFKKSLVAVAVLGAVAFSAQAADVQLYGRIDTGVRYTNIDADVANQDDVSKFEMSSGNSTGNRFGLKATEDLAMA